MACLSGYGVHRCGPPTGTRTGSLRALGCQPWGSRCFWLGEQPHRTDTPNRGYPASRPTTSRHRRQGRAETPGPQTQQHEQRGSACDGHDGDGSTPWTSKRRSGSVGGTDRRWSTCDRSTGDASPDRNSPNRSAPLWHSYGTAGRVATHGLVGVEAMDATSPPPTDRLIARRLALNRDARNEALETHRIDGNERGVRQPASEALRALSGGSSGARDA